MPDTPTNIPATATTEQQADQQPAKPDTETRPSDSTIEWMIRSNKNSERMSRDEAYRLEIAKHLS